MSDSVSVESAPYLPPEESKSELDEHIKVIDKSKIKSLKHKRKTVIKHRKPKPAKLFSDGPKVTEASVNELTKRTPPNQYPGDREQYSFKVMVKAWSKRMLTKDDNIPISEKKTGKQMLNDDLFDRLYVKCQPTTTKTIVDFDSHWFSMVEGRPFEESLSTKAYVQIIRDVLKTKIVMGYLEDDIMLINENLLNEQNAIQKIQKNYQKCVSIFDELIFKDHMSAKEFLKQADNLSKELYEKNKEYKVAVKQFSSIKTSLYGSEERWNNCKIFQKFLFNLSPLHWKIENKDQLPDESFMDDNREEEEEARFAKQRESMADKIMEVDEMLSHVNEELKTPAPKIYFTEPEQILELYEYMETQNLNYLTHAEELAVPLANLRNGTELAILLFDNEIEALNQSVKDLSCGIEWEERRARNMEEMANSLIFVEFKKLVMSDQILNLYVSVEDIYESRIGQNDANMSILEMMRGIEQKYRQELLNLDMVPHEIVSSLEGSCFTEQQRVMKLAETATKQFAELDVMTKQLNRAFDKKYEKGHSKETKRRSKLMVPPKPPRPPPRKFSLEEDDYLEHFTDFCKFTDDPKTYGVDLNKPESTGKPLFGTAVVQQEEPKAYTAMATSTVKYVKRIPGIDAITKLMNLI